MDRSGRVFWWFDRHGTVRWRARSPLCRRSPKVGRGVPYYRWRAEFGGLKLDQAKRLKELERENQRLRKAVVDLTLDKLIL